ncbi:acylglycerol kinase, mitochondrial-like [Watersipora subatra]|uniref:acylglycerol kinase, mitochondrial-like n=1 Tax=Watersipora subatra TaxID=2589382 RepID=UPI00355BB6E6
MAKVFKTLRNNWKKSIFFSGCFLYAAKYALKWRNEDLLMKDYCKKAREFGRQTISASERPRKAIIFLNPAAKDGKTKYLLDKHVLPLLHLAGIEIHIVRTEHEGQAKAYMGVLDNSIVDAIIVAGGDGTISEIVTGLLRRGDGIAQRVPIGVLPFGTTNTFASRLFPKRELEVERYCQASMAIINNKCSHADVIEVEPLGTPHEGEEKSLGDVKTSSVESVNEKAISADSPANVSGLSAGNKNIYIMSNLKWGVHSDIDRKKGKYWYMPGPLKEYYCYLKQVLFGEWPALVSAQLEFSPPCEGCKNCLAPPPVTALQPVKKSVWWWPTDNRKVQPSAPARDPRLEKDNPLCGVKQRKEVCASQLDLESIATKSGTSCSHLELYLTPVSTSKGDLLTKPVVPEEPIPLSQVTITPKSSLPVYIMDSEDFEDVHEGLVLPPNCDKSLECSGYSYYHYGCDGFDDSGWGCGYRTLQTICSWIHSHAETDVTVPNIPEIQDVLVAMGDKDASFLGSKQWIGSVEVGLVVDKLFDVPCKILHVQSGSQLYLHIPELITHFSNRKSPIMMGGESDTSSKGIIGVATSSSNDSTYLLILDPHYLVSKNQRALNLSQLQEDGWVKWVNINSFHQNTFYNLCLPMTQHL